MYMRDRNMLHNRILCMLCAEQSISNDILIFIIIISIFHYRIQAVTSIMLHEYFD